ncbi:MAG: type I restriction-modification system subunit M N-terminal domain-containing protein [Rikenellaceae bacterium]
MTTENRQRKTSTNIQEKANLIWAIADKLVGLYKPHEYGKVILPMCVIKRFEDILKPTKQAVIEKNKYCDEHKIEVREPLLRTAAKQQFYNTSEFTFELLLADADNIHDNFEFYLSRFSNNVIDIISRMDFHNEIKKIRQIFGTKDESCPKVFNNPYKATKCDFAWDSDLSYTETIPWKDDIEEYLDKNVRPYAADFVVDDSKTKIGYEIPLTREFYKYVELDHSDDIFKRFKELESQEAELMIKILG